MKQRRGLTVGSGLKGYYNVLPNDALIHGLSAKGVSQNLYAKSRSLPLELIRVPYGKASTKPKDREYVMRGGSPVGTLTEWESFANLKNIDKVIVNDIDDVFMFSVGKKKMKTLKAESISSEFTTEVDEPIESPIPIPETPLEIETKEEEYVETKEDEMPQPEKTTTFSSNVKEKLDSAKQWISKHRKEHQVKPTDDVSPIPTGEIEEKSTPAIEDLSDAELEDMAVHQQPSFLSSLTGMSNQYEKELIRRTEQRAKIQHQKDIIAKKVQLARQRLDKKLEQAEKGALETPQEKIVKAGTGVWGFITNPSGDTSSSPKSITRKQRKNKGGNGNINFKEFLPIP